MGLLTHIHYLSEPPHSPLCGLPAAEPARLALSSSEDPELKCQIWSGLLWGFILLPSEAHPASATAEHEEARSQQGHLTAVV